MKQILRTLILQKVVESHADVATTTLAKCYTFHSHLQYCRKLRPQSFWNSSWRNWCMCFEVVLYLKCRVQVQEGLGDAGGWGGLQALQCHTPHTVLQQWQLWVQAWPLRDLLLHEWCHRALWDGTEDDGEGDGGWVSSSACQVFWLPCSSLANWGVSNSLLSVSFGFCCFLCSLST